MRNFYIVVPALSLINMGVNGATIANVLTSRGDGPAEATGPYKLRGMNTHQDRQIHTADFSSTDAPSKDEAVSPRQLLDLPLNSELPGLSLLGIRDPQPFMPRQNADETTTDSSDDAEAEGTDSAVSVKRQVSVKLSSSSSSAPGATNDLSVSGDRNTNTESYLLGQSLTGLTKGAGTDATSTVGSVKNVASNSEGQAFSASGLALNDIDLLPNIAEGANTEASTTEGGATNAASSAESLESGSSRSALNSLNLLLDLTQPAYSETTSAEGKATKMGSNAERLASTAPLTASDEFNTLVLEGTSVASKEVPTSKVGDDAVDSAIKGAKKTTDASSLSLSRRDDFEGSDCNEARDVTRGFTSNGQPIMIARDVEVPSLSNLPGPLGALPIVGGLGQRGVEFVGTLNGGKFVDTNAGGLPVRGLQFTSLINGLPIGEVTTRALTLAFNNETLPSIISTKRQDSSTVDITDAGSATGAEGAAADVAEAVEGVTTEDTVQDAVDAVRKRQDSSDVVDANSAAAEAEATFQEVGDAVNTVTKRQDTSVDADADTSSSSDADTVDTAVQDTSADATVDATVTKRQDTSMDVDTSDTEAEGDVVEDTTDTTVAKRQGNLNSDDLIPIPRRSMFAIRAFPQGSKPLPRMVKRSVRRQDSDSESTDSDVTTTDTTTAAAEGTLDALD